MAKVFAVAAVTTAVDELPASVNSKVSSVSAVPVFSCVADGPAVDVFLSMLFRPWSPCHG